MAKAKNKFGKLTDLWTTADIARACGVSQSFVRQLVSEGVLEKAPGSGALNYFEAGETIQKVIGRLKQRREPSAHELASQAAQLAKLQAEARKSQMAADEMERRLVDINEATRVWKDVGIRFRERLRNLGARLAPLFAFETDVMRIRLNVEKEIDEALTALEKTDLRRNDQYAETENQT